MYASTVCLPPTNRLLSGMVVLECAKSRKRISNLQQCSRVVENMAQGVGLRSVRLHQLATESPLLAPAVGASRGTVVHLTLGD